MHLLLVHIQFALVVKSQERDQKSDKILLHKGQGIIMVVDWSTGQVRMQSSSQGPLLSGQQFCQFINSVSLDTYIMLSVGNLT